VDSVATDCFCIRNENAEIQFVGNRTRIDKSVSDFHFAFCPTDSGKYDRDTQNSPTPPSAVYYIYVRFATGKRRRSEKSENRSFVGRVSRNFATKIRGYYLTPVFEVKLLYARKISGSRHDVSVMTE